MASSHATGCFGLFLILSSLLYISEIALCARSAFVIYENEALRSWLFVPYGGLLLLPMVCLQLVSAVLMLMKQGDRLSTTSSICAAILHILQLGFLWRHLSLFREVDPTIKAKEIADLNVLQMVHTFSSIIPLMILQSFSVINYQMYDWIWLLTIFVMLVGSSVRLAAYRNSHGHKSCHSVLAFFSRFVWRFGELSSRISSLVVFASVYYFWVFLIFLLHAVTMMVCLCTSILGIFDNVHTTRTHRTTMGCLVAYLYSFCFVDLSSNGSVFRYVFYYVVMFFENVVLIIVWCQRSDLSSDNSIETIIIIVTASMFAFGVLAMTVYLKCFNHGVEIDEEKEEICAAEECINCRLSLCSKHNIKLQRPFSAGWISQYQEALKNGNYYKNLLQDAMIDSDWESTHDCLNSSGEHWQIRDTDLESLRTIDKTKRQYTSVQGSGTYTHKRFFDSDPNISKRCGDNDSISSRSGMYDEDWRLKSDTVLSQLSAQDTLSLLSSRTKLLTDSWDCLIKEDECPESHTPKQPKRIDILNSLIRKDLDTSFFSDGYTTDHTMDSYQLPITVLAKKKAFINYRKVQPTYSVASDSTDCTICAFIKHNESPASSRRTSHSHLDLSRDSCYDEIRNARRENGQTRGKPVDLARKAKTKDYVQRRTKSGRHEAIYTKRDLLKPPSSRSRQHESRIKPATATMPPTDAPLVADVSTLYSVPLKTKKSAPSSAVDRTVSKANTNLGTRSVSTHIYHNQAMADLQEKRPKQNRVIMDSTKLPTAPYFSDSKTSRKVCVNMFDGSVLPNTSIPNKRDSEHSSHHSSLHSERPRKAKAPVSCSSNSERSSVSAHKGRHEKRSRSRNDDSAITATNELDRIMIDLKKLPFVLDSRPPRIFKPLHDKPEVAIHVSTGSESSDSAYPRHTPLSSYLLATDDDQDGRSESSCEMVI